MLFGLLVVFPLGCLNHTEYVSRRCTLAVRHQISQGDTELVFEAFDGRMIRFRYDLSIPASVSIVPISHD